MDSDSKNFLKNQGPYFLLRNPTPKSSDGQADYIKEDILSQSLFTPHTPQHLTSYPNNKPYFDIAGPEELNLNRTYTSPGDEKHFSKLGSAFKNAKEENNRSLDQPPRKSYQEILERYSITKSPKNDEDGYVVKDSENFDELFQERSRSPKASQKSLKGNFGDLSPVTPKRLASKKTTLKFSDGNNELMTPDKVIEEIPKKDPEAIVNLMDFSDRPSNHNPGSPKGGNARKHQTVNESNFAPSLSKPDLLNGSGIQESFRLELANRSALNHSRATNRTRTGRLVKVNEINYPTLRITIISAKGKLKREPKLRSPLSSSRFNRSQFGRAATQRDSSDKGNSEQNLSRIEINRSIIDNYKQSEANNKREIQTGLFAMLKKPKYSDFLKNPDEFLKKAPQPELVLLSKSQTSLEEEKKKLQQQIDVFTQQAGEYLENARARLEELEEASMNAGKDESTLKNHYERNIQKKASTLIKNSPAQVQEEIEKNKIAEASEEHGSIYERVMKKGKK